MMNWIKKIKQKKDMQNNGIMTFDTNVNRNYSKQKNLIHFVLNNFIIMERNPTFIAINTKMIKISLIRQMQKEYFSLYKIELFAVIKYINHKDLIELANEYLVTENKNNIFLKLDVKTLNWLVIKVLPNIVKMFNENKTVYSYFENQLKNILYICSFTSISKNQSRVMLKEIKILINYNKISLDIYENINKFINSQQDIAKKDLIDIVEMMINKIICNSNSIWGYKAIEGNYLWSPFRHLNRQNISYSNVNLIDKFLKTVESYSEKQKIQLSQSFLMNMHIISNDEIQNKIKEFYVEYRIKS